MNKRRIEIEKVKDKQIKNDETLDKRRYVNYNSKYIFVKNFF